MKYKFLLAPAALLLTSAAANAATYSITNFDVSGLNQDVIEDRLSMVGPLFNGWDRTFKQGDPWLTAYGFHNRIAHNQNKDKGAALSLGYDHVIADNFRIGLALNGGKGQVKHGDVDGHGSSIFYGVNLYSTWTGKKVNVIANLGYTHSKIDSKFKYDGFDLPLGDGKAKSWNAGLRFETSFVAGGLSFVPYYSVRFTRLLTDDVSVAGDLLDGRLDASFSGASIWQFPVGVNVGYEYVCPGGWKSRSMLDFAVIPTAGDKKITANLGGFASDTERFANSLLFRGKVGLQLSKGQHSFGFLYSAGAAAHSSVSQNVTVNYQFMY